MTARGSHTVYDGDYLRLHNAGLWEPMYGWLTANGITPQDVAANEKIVIGYSPSGRGWITYRSLRRRDDGIIEADEDGRPVTVERETMMTADLPLPLLLGQTG